MKFSDIKAKLTGLCEKIGKRGMVVICSVLLVGMAVALNLLLFNGKSTEKSGLAIDRAALEAAAGDASGDEEAPVYNYFEAMQLSRSQARDEAMEVLLSVAESETAVEDMKREALTGIEQIARDIENEANIETLILSKGFTRCVAVVSGDSASVIVKSSGLLPSEIAQISEIVYEQAGITPANLKIIEKDV